MRLLQARQPVCLLDVPPVFLLPLIVRLLGEAELPAGVGNPALARLNRNGP